MELYEKIKFIRSLKGWTQENVADQLGISTHAYAKIERGETDVHFSRLQQIANVMEIELPKLLGLDEKNVFNLTNSQCHNNFDNWHVNSSSTEQIACKHQLEKAQLMIEQKEKEIDYLKQQVIDLREMNQLLKMTKEE